jgi:hypothetical protein
VVIVETAVQELLERVFLDGTKGVGSRRVAKGRQFITTKHEGIMEIQTWQVAW